MSLRAKVVHGLSWNLLGRVGTQVFQLGFSIVLARLLTPKEFGAIGMLVVFTGFAQLLSDSGLNSALIYNQELTEDHCSTAFWLQLVIGVCLNALFFFGAPLVARFYALPILTDLTRLISLVFVVQAAGQTQYALLTKEFKFRKLASVNIAATFISGILAIVLAKRGFGVFALAWQMIALAATSAILYWFVSSWRPQFKFKVSSAKELGRYAAYLMGHGWLNYWTRNGDNLTIGKILGANPLGIYARAYSLMLLPLNNISNVLGQVMFPALSRMQDDLPRFGRTYLAATRLIALVSFPVMAGMTVLSGPLVDVLFGPKWVEVTPLLRILSIIGLAQSIIFPVGWVFTGLGQTKAQFKLSIFLLFAFAVAMFLGIRHGLMGVVYAYMAWTVLSGGLNLHIAGGLMNLSAWKILRSVWKITGMSILMSVVIVETELRLSISCSSAMRLTAGTLIGMAAYLLLCVATRNDTFSEFVGFIGLKRRKPLDALAASEGAG